MKTTFPEFGNFLKIFLLIAFLNISNFNLHAQSSFDFRIDGLASGITTTTWADKIRPCADGGFFMTGLNGWEDYFVIKTDSVGNVEWSKVLLQGNQLDPAEIIATNDSGFYFMNNQLDGWVGLFNSVTISKVDKYGNILKSRYIPHLQVPPDGNENVFCDVDPINNDLLIMGRYYDYDGSSGACCHEYYLYKMDSSLNVIFCTRLDNGVEGALDRINMKSKSVYLNNQVAGYIAMGLLNYSPNYGSYVYYLDSIGNLVWTRKYFGLQFKDFVQVGNNLFFISSRSLGGNTYSSKIIKTDFSGNIILSKELQLSGSLLLDGISANASGELLISGSHFSLPPIIRSNLLMLSDTSLNLMVAKKGGIFNSNFWTNTLPVGNLNCFLIAKIEQFGNFTNAIFEKIDFSNPLCNYANLPISNIPVAVIDSVVNYSNLPYPLTLINDTIEFIPEFFNYSIPCLTLDVEDVNGNPDIHLLNVNPNPASDYIELSLDEAENSSQVTIYNITGEAVGKFEMDGNNRIIPIADLSQGIYFVNVITEKQQFNAKFIKL
jgi:hypothetical protein